MTDYKEMVYLHDYVDDLENYLGEPRELHESLALYSMVDKDGKRVPPTKEYEEHLMEKLKRGDYTTVHTLKQVLCVKG